MVNPILKNLIFYSLTEVVNAVIAFKSVVLKSSFLG